jgi:cytochrome b561
MNEGHDAAIYSAPARAMHWITAALVLTLIPAGIAMGNAAPGPTADFLFNLHRSLGVLLIPVVLARLAWRVTHSPPLLPPDMPFIMYLAAELTHFALYVLLIVQPILGWIATSAYRAPVVVFGLFELPPIWAEDRAFSDRLFGAHRLLGFAMAALILAHIAGALFHQFVRRDNLLARMWR